MKRLYDRIVRQDPGLLYPPDLAWLHPLLAGVQQFDVSNVSRYYFSETDQEDWRPSRDLPNLAPAYPAMWFEYPIPGIIRSDVHGLVDNRGNVGRHGILIHATDLSAGERPPLRVSQVLPGTRWLLVVAAYSHTTRLDGQPENHTMVMPLVCLLFIDGTGRSLAAAHPDGDLIEFAFSAQAPRNDFVRRSLWGASVPALLVLSLLHCKNVIVEEHQPPATTSRRNRHGARQYSSFKTLHVTPMRKIVRHEPAADSGDRAGSRFHHKRGHFKSYTEEAPLFGRWTGTWWWSDQVVGDLSLGQIDKVYTVDPVQDQQKAPD